jgi:hypothetical protein
MEAINIEPAVQKAPDPVQPQGGSTSKYGFNGLVISLKNMISDTL